MQFVYYLFLLETTVVEVICTVPVGGHINYHDWYAKGHKQQIYMKS